MTIGSADRRTLNTWRHNEGETILREKIATGRGNTNAKKSGMFVNKCINEDERALFDKIVDGLKDDLNIKDTVDLMQVELVGLYFLKTLRSIKIPDKVEFTERLDRMLRLHLKDLKATRITREEINKNTGNSPAEWISAFISSYQDKKNVK